MFAALSLKQNLLLLLPEADGKGLALGQAVCDLVHLNI
jgi:hypothetical protein